MKVFCFNSLPNNIRKFRKDVSFQVSCCIQRFISSIFSEITEAAERYWTHEEMIALHSFQCNCINAQWALLTQLFIQKQSLLVVVCEMSSHNFIWRTWIGHCRVLCDMQWKSFQYESKMFGKSLFSAHSTINPQLSAYYCRCWLWSHTNVDFINHLINTQIENLIMVLRKINLVVFCVCFYVCVKS